MLTIHAADLLFGARHRRPGDPTAVAVDGGLIAAVGALGQLVAAHPQARVRRWPGLLLPGLVNADAVELLEATYHPDPREADELGTQPLTGEALDALGLDEMRRSASARRGLQLMLAHGTTAVVGPFTLPEVRSAVARSGLRLRERAPGPQREESGAAPSLDPFVRRPLNAVPDGDLTPGAPADFAVFDVPTDVLPARALREHGARTCVATVLGGRLVYRRR
ncbi:amidohydrolase family protein [Streptomyces wuyuanensis]|uniref:Aminodeoxyfutalosine deaminase/Imidazolonepropionase-like composite domain-containing protein n=1 Tax=Streptomyces wuyuanensis TaxID=1196353 RepID=A0A1H0CKL5_9ACTN|nr:hypothetical protein [Streptomyces wuyuanensis]SDN58437.1 hypothetical protein SAMN05444921_13074 [Streptomyces wuyuanensis]